jgi:hypothetical protein
MILPKGLKYVLVNETFYIRKGSSFACAELLLVTPKNRLALVSLELAAENMFSDDPHIRGCWF